MIIKKRSYNNLKDLSIEVIDAYGQKFVIYQGLIFTDGEEGKEE